VADRTRFHITELGKQSALVKDLHCSDIEAEAARFTGGFLKPLEDDRCDPRERQFPGEHEPRRPGTYDNYGRVHRYSSFEFRMRTATDEFSLGRAAAW
jgi:hypothetical protein